MSFLAGFKQRAEGPEWMDLADSDERQLFNTLRQFRGINRWLTPCRPLLQKQVIATMRTEPDRVWTLVDLGAGGCDLPLWLAEQCQSQSLTVEITCLDADERVVRFAQERTQHLGSVTVELGDALRLVESGRKWDFVFANHFLHHFSDADIIRLLRIAHEVARHSYCLCDIQRSWFTYLSYTAMAAVLWRDSFAFDDGRLSIRKGFALAECRDYIRSAGLDGQAIARHAVPLHLVIQNVR